MYCFAISVYEKFIIIHIYFAISAQTNETIEHSTISIVLLCFKYMFQNEMSPNFDQLSAFVLGMRALL